MTSDAKIGLLLGLVFIFVIAFIINGLPNLRPQTGRAEVPTNMVSLTDEDFGVADKARKAQETLDWTSLIDEQRADADDTGETAGIAEESRPVATEPLQPPTANDQDVRSIIPLPSIEALLQHLTSGMQSQREPTATVSMDVPGVATDQPVTPAPRTKPAETVRRTASTREPAKPASKTHVVAEGESLASVAKKVYGPEEGNKLVNVQRIYEANRDILKSPDEVIAGQKLVIPPLPQSAPGPKKPEEVLSAALFKFQTESGARPASAAAPPKSREGRWYVVQDGDNLWKIAVSQLGSGARYEEIVKLNALKDKDSLDVGMRLRLPAK